MSDEVPRVSLNALSNEQWDPSRCRREDIACVPRAFLLRNLLTADECDALLQSAERVGYAGFAKSAEYRNQERMICFDADTAATVFERIRPFMQADEHMEVTAQQAASYECTHDSEGRWSAVGLNELIRVMNYPPGGHFAPHYDAFELVAEENLSLYTILIYLNDEFEGGSTNFVDNSLPLTKDGELGIYMAPESAILHRVVPEKGMALLFYQRTMHEGERVLSGRKYALRSDVIYRRDPASKPQWTAEQQEARRLFDEAERLESAGQLEAAIACYKRVMVVDPVFAQSKGLC